MNITVTKPFSHNDAVFGLSNVNVVVNDECMHVNTRTEVETHLIMRGDDVKEYEQNYEVCVSCKSYRVFGNEAWEYA